MNRILRILCGVACAFVFCFLAIGYAAVQDTLLVTGSVSIVPQDKVFAVYGEAFDSNGDSLGIALNFYNRAMPEVGGTITLTNEDGTMTYGRQTVTELYTGFDAEEYSTPLNRAWSMANGQNVVSVSVIDEGIQPMSTACWFTNFNQCTNFDLLKLDTSNVTNMAWMFSTCSVVTELDLSSFDTSKVTNMMSMFTASSSLETILVSEYFVTDSTEASNVFNDNNSLKGGAGTAFSNDVDLSYARIDGGSEHPGYFTYYKYALVFEANGGLGAPDVLLSDDGSFTIPSNTDTVSNDGYPLLGWATTENATTEQYRAGSSLNISEDTPYCQVLYAVYDKPRIVTNQTDFEKAVEEKKDCIVEGGTYKYIDMPRYAVNITINNAKFTGYVDFTDHKTIMVNGLEASFNSTPIFMIGSGTEMTIIDATITGSGGVATISNGATLTIEGGTYTRPNFVYAGYAGSKLIINGGTFKNITSFEALAGAVGNVTITGGTFGFDPSEYIPETHTVVGNDDGTWTVVLNANAAFVNEDKVPACSCETKCIELSAVCEVCKTDFTLCEGTEAPAGEELTCTCESKCSELTEACEVCKTNFSLCKGTEPTQPVETTESETPGYEQEEQSDTGEEQTTPPNNPLADEPLSDDGQGEQPTEGVETTTPSDVSDGDVVETEETDADGEQETTGGEETTAPTDATETAILPSEDEEDGEETEQPQDTETDPQGQE